MQHYDKNNGPNKDFWCFLGVPRHMLGYFLKGIYIHFCLILSILSFYFLILCNKCCCHTENIKDSGNHRPRMYWFLILSINLFCFYWRSLLHLTRIISALLLLKNCSKPLEAGFLHSQYKVLGPWSCVVLLLNQEYWRAGQGTRPFERRDLFKNSSI